MRTLAISKLTPTGRLPADRAGGAYSRCRRAPEIGALATTAGLAHAMAGLLKAFPIHAARGQLSCRSTSGRHGADRQTADERAGDAGAARSIGRMRLCARRHLFAAHELIATAPAPSYRRCCRSRSQADGRAHGAARLRSVHQSDRAMAAAMLIWRAASRPARILRSPMTGSAKIGGLGQRVALKRKPVAQVAAIGEDAGRQGCVRARSRAVPRSGRPGSWQ